MPVSENHWLRLLGTDLKIVSSLKLYASYKTQTLDANASGLLQACAVNCGRVREGPQKTAVVKRDKWDKITFVRFVRGIGADFHQIEHHRERQCFQA